MLVRMGSHVLKAEDTRSFLSKAFANCLVQIKRNFDRHVVCDVLLYYQLPTIFSLYFASVKFHVMLKYCNMLFKLL